MSIGLTADLAFAGGAVLLAAWLLLLRPLGGRVALVLALARVGLAVVYFGFLDDGDWRLQDDVTYVEQALELGSAGGGAAGVLLDPQAGALLGAVAGGQHFGYYAFNLLAFEAFGDHYWSPVLVNVLLSFVAALGLLSIARSAGFGQGVQVPLAAAFLLHPDVIAWSGFFNLKDTLVLTLIVWLFALALRLERTFKLRDLTALVMVGAVLSVVRSYALVLFGVALVAWAFANARWSVRFLFLGATIAALPFVPRAGLENFKLGAAPLGFVEFTLTPRPWGVTENYEFLVIPATVHWLLLPLSVWGAIWLWRSAGRVVRLPLIYGAVLIAFYACVPLLAGPRHRFQLAFVLVAVQLAGAHALMHEVLAGRLGPRARKRGAAGESGDSSDRARGGGEWSASVT